MRKFILLIASILSVWCGIVLAGEPDKILKAVGAHPGSTAAPGEQTCAQAGCHANATISPGDNVNTFTLGNNLTEYTPGKTHSIKIRAQRAGTSRFGFEVVALDKDYKSIGTWKITEFFRTQIINTTIDGADRYYVTHKIAGTTATSPGVNEWTFDWTPPGDYTDSVKFYYVVNATNNDNTNSGDHLYVSSVAFAAASPNSVIEDNTSASSVVIYPNPAASYIVLKNVLPNSSVHLFDNNGNAVLQDISKENGRISIKELPAGKYFVQIKETSGKTKTTSFIKQ